MHLHRASLERKGGEEARVRPHSQKQFIPPGARGIKVPFLCPAWVLRKKITAHKREKKDILELIVTFSKPCNNAVPLGLRALGVVTHRPLRLALE